MLYVLLSFFVESPPYEKRGGVGHLPHDVKKEEAEKFPPFPVTPEEKRKGEEDGVVSPTHRDLGVDLVSMSSLSWA